MHLDQPGKIQFMSSLALIINEFDAPGQKSIKALLLLVRILTLPLFQDPTTLPKYFIAVLLHSIFVYSNNGNCSTLTYHEFQATAFS